MLLERRDWNIIKLVECVKDENVIHMRKNEWDVWKEIVHHKDAKKSGWRGMNESGWMRQGIRRTHRQSTSIGEK